ncbi:MAG: nuclear transport factor 2 family protein [Proteobacteria bacterium]|nr:nuclear transport factor 2 family protein [Pseudomonadota bacterium]HQR02829.1 nuclear transport factor 2 family protein [Rhodocyclaceae bacterium]
MSDPATANRNLIQCYFDILRGQRPDLALADCFNKDARWHVPPSNPMIRPNPKIGIEGIMEVLGSGVAIYAPGSLDILIDTMIADAENVAVPFTLKARLADGRPYENRYFFRFRIANGRIAEVWEYLDTLYQEQQGTFNQASA